MASSKAKNLSNLKQLGKNFIFFSRLAYKSARFHFSFFFIISLLESGLPVLSAKYFGNLIDSMTNFVQSGDSVKVWYFLAIYAVVFITPNIIDIFSIAAQNIYSMKFQDYLNVFLLRKRGAVDIAHIENPEYQDLSQKAFMSGNQPIIQIIEGGINILSMLFICIIGAVVLLKTNWIIFAVVVVLSIPKFVIETKFGGYAWTLMTQNSRDRRVIQELWGFFTGKFAVIESKLFQAQDFFLDKLTDIYSSLRGEKIALEKTKLGGRLIAEILSTFGMFIGLSIAIQSALGGLITVGTIVFIFQIITSFNRNAKSFFFNMAGLLEKNLYVTDIRQVIDVKPVIIEQKHPKKVTTEYAPEIEFRNVSFKYPNQHEYVIENISFIIESGQKFGLVGHNGAGKTTIVRLLLRIHDPSEGQIFVDGIDLKELKVADWWSMLSVLPQDFSFFRFSAKNAISYSDVKKEFDIEKVKTAARTSTASDFIEKWPEQYDRMIGVEFGGAELSKGEKQKMALARVFYRDAKIFVLDEPTAAVDSSSTSEIFRNIEKISDKQSVLIISHNFAALRRANKIVMIEHGKIEEEGTHEELMANNGEYKKLYEQQKGEYE